MSDIEHATTLTKDQSLELMQAEIERLRRSLDDHLDSEAAETRRADRERDRARTAEAEIERLREGLRARTANCDAKAKEIERLRGLLRECIEWVEFKEDGGLRYAHGAPELVKRVREALGD